MQNFVKHPVVITLSLLINALLFLLIRQLVSNEIVSLPKFEELNWVDFIQLEQQKTTSEHKTKKTRPEEPPPEKTPELPKMKQPETPEPEQININIPAPAIDIPLGTTGIPYLGDFLKTPPPASTRPEMPKMEIATNLVPTTRIEPVYPPRALRAGIEGAVTAEFTIDTNGSVKDIDIVKAEPPNVFERAVITAIKKWKFSPQIVDGKTVERRARQEIKFTLRH